MNKYYIIYGALIIIVCILTGTYLEGIRIMIGYEDMKSRAENAEFIASEIEGNVKAAEDLAELRLLHIEKQNGDIGRLVMELEDCRQLNQE